MCAPTSVCLLASEYILIKVVFQSDSAFILHILLSQRVGKNYRNALDEDTKKSNS